MYKYICMFVFKHHIVTYLKKKLFFFYTRTVQEIPCDYYTTVNKIINGWKKMQKIAKQPLINISYGIE